MSYFGVSNPELDSPLSGMRAARKGRARAQRKRQSHSQMAGRNGGFADPREIMAYHNKGELSDAATIQALSLFGIGGVRAKGMLGGSHRARQQSAMMGARRQQASFRSMGSHNGSPDDISVLAYQDRNGGNWSIEINQKGSHYGFGTKCDWRIKSIDSDNSMYNVWVKSGTADQYDPARYAAQAAIEELVEDAPQDYVVDEFGENFQDALGNFWAIRYSTQYTGGQITWVNWTVSSVTLNLSYTGQAETKAAGRIAALNAVDAWVATQQVNNDGGGDATGGNGGDDFTAQAELFFPPLMMHNGYYYEIADMSSIGNGWAYSIYPPEASSITQFPQTPWPADYVVEDFDYSSVLVLKDGFDSGFDAYYAAQSWIDETIGGGDPAGGNQAQGTVTETFTWTHTAVPDMPSTWTVIMTKRDNSGPPLYMPSVINYTYTASSPNYDYPLDSGTQTFSSFEATKAAAKEKIHNSIMASIPDNDEGTGGNGGGTGGNGAETGGSGVSTSDLTEYTSAQDVIDGRKLGVIDYMDALNTLVRQFGWSENEASEALRTESSSNDYYISDTDGDTFRDTRVDNTLPVQAQTQQVVPADTGFNMPSTPVLVGGAILVAGVTAVAYTSRRN